MNNHKKILLIGGVGYCGSVLYKHLQESGYWVHSIDLELFKNRTRLANEVISYTKRPVFSVGDWDTVVLLAGYSSAYFCKDHPIESLFTNCINFFNFVQKLPAATKFIYASSASVYGNSGTRLMKELDVLSNPVSEYDRQKQFLDYFMSEMPHHYYGLRFGTVCGYSPNPRNELLINSMVKAAKTTGVVKVNSSESWRAVLGIQDLCRAVERIIEDSSYFDKGIYNLASFNANIGSIGKFIAEKYNAKLESTEDGDSLYSFCMDTSKFQKTFRFQFEQTIDTIAMDCERNDFSICR